MSIEEHLQNRIDEINAVSNTMQFKVGSILNLRLHSMLPSWGRYIGTKFYTLEELEEFDIFNVVNGEGNAEIFEEYDRETEDIVRHTNQIAFSPPPLDSGVMKVILGTHPHAIRWKVHDRGEDYFKVTIDAYLIDSYRWVGRATFDSDEVADWICNPVYEALPHIRARLLSSKLPRSNKDMVRNALVDEDELLLNYYMVRIMRAYLVGMNLFYDLLEDDSEKIPVESERVSVKTGFRKVGGERRRVIYLNGVSVECGRESNVSVRRGQIVRTCEAWSVRGHYRHYQNGKVVYIEPYEKGRERNQGKVRGKEYKVK